MPFLVVSTCPLCRYSQPSVNVGQPALYFRLSIHFTDGTVQSVVSDLSWTVRPEALNGHSRQPHSLPCPQVTAGPVVMNDIYNGETYDGRCGPRITSQ